MNHFRTIVLALTTVAAASVGAQTVYTGSADQERRERNREEALTHYRDATSMPAARGERSESLREKTREGAASVREGTHRAAESTRRVAHKTAREARRVGHNTAAKARDVTARVDARLPAKTQPSVNPDGINPVNMSTKSPTAPSNGVVK
jgi:CHASE1-domain containing sensor protein